MPNESNIKDSLEELSKSSSTLNRAKVKSRTWAGGRRNANKDTAASLLSSIMEDSSKAAEEERKRAEEERKRAEEEERIRKEEEELRLQIEGEQLIQQEQKAQDELWKNQNKMAQKVQREKDIEAGLIDVEAEERAKREAEAKKKAEEEAKARKAEQKKQQRELLAKQREQLAELQKKEEIEAAKPAPSKAPVYIAVAAVLLIGIAGIVYAVTHPTKTDFYEFTEDDYGYTEFQTKHEDTKMLEVAVSMVQQHEEVKTTPKPSGPKKRTTPSNTAPAQNTQRPGLNAGKGGGLGAGKGGGLGAGKGGGLGGRR